MAAANAYHKLTAKKKPVMTGVTNRMLIEEVQENSETAFTAETSLSKTEDETFETSENVIRIIIRIKISHKVTLQCMYSTLV